MAAGVINATVVSRLCGEFLVYFSRAQDGFLNDLGLYFHFLGVLCGFAVNFWLFQWIQPRDTPELAPGSSGQPHLEREIILSRSKNDFERHPGPLKP